MKIFYTLLITLVFICFAESQNKNKFAGFIKIQDTLFIKYKIEFDESNGEISGFSFTDFGGVHETKSRISGLYDANKKLLSFKEIELIYTKSPVSLDDYDFCNINLEPSRFKLGSDKLMGKFVGKFSDGVSCYDGELAMNSVEKITKRVNKFSSKVQNSKRIADSIKAQVKNIKIIDTLNLNVLKKNEITTVLTNSNTLELHIYDGGQIDDDVVSIFKDDEIILRRYGITLKKKILKVNLDQRKTQIKILSESVGSIGSNTAIIEIIDGNNTIETMTNLEKGEVTKIDIVKREY